MYVERESLACAGDLNIAGTDGTLEEDSEVDKLDTDKFDVKLEKFAKFEVDENPNEENSDCCVVCGDGGVCGV